MQVQSTFVSSQTLWVIGARDLYNKFYKRKRQNDSIGRHKNSEGDFQTSNTKTSQLY